jgi:hypothetical protein
VSKTIVLWTLVTLLALSNLRMICVDHAIGGPASAAVSLGADCTDMCPREPAPRPKTGCVLVPGGCSAVSAFVVALPPPSVVLAPPPSRLVATTVGPDLYTAPAPALFSPPPEL